MIQIVGENASKISRFAGYLRDVFQPTTDLATIELASQTLGHLVRSGGALTADVVESEVRSPRIAESMLPRPASLTPGCAFNRMWTFIIHTQVRRAIDWLQRSQSDSRRYAAVLVLQELAENAPAVFNVHVRAFIDAIWSALRDPKIHVREAAVSALQVSEWPLSRRSFLPGVGLAW